MRVRYNGSRSVKNGVIESFSFRKCKWFYRSYGWLHGNYIDGSNSFLKELNLNKYY